MRLFHAAAMSIIFLATPITPDSFGQDVVPDAPPTGREAYFRLRSENRSDEVSARGVSAPPKPKAAEPAVEPSALAPTNPAMSSPLTLDTLGTDTTGGNTNVFGLEHSTPPTSWRDNLRATLDISSRPSYFGKTGQFGNFTFIGLDVHKVITNSDGDVGTLTLQPYLTRIDNIDGAPRSIFDDPYDWELVYRIFNFNYTAKGKGKTNWRFGHFEVPFGLEQVINTNGTLRDYTHGANFGLKADWGVTFNGENSDVEYEIGLSRGSGNKFRSRHDPFVLAGRVGTSREEAVILGASAFHGETLNFSAAGGTTRRTRVGVDMTVAGEELIYLAELSAGFQEDSRVFTSLFEVDWFNKDETFLLYNQFVVRGLGPATGWDYEVRDSIGVRWQPDSHWALSTQVSHFFDSLGPSGRGSLVQVQARYRF